MNKSVWKNKYVMRLWRDAVHTQKEMVYGGFLNPCGFLENPTGYLGLLGVMVVYKKNMWFYFFLNVVSSDMSNKNPKKSTVHTLRHFTINRLRACFYMNKNSIKVLHIIIIIIIYIFINISINYKIIVL